MKTFLKALALIIIISSVYGVLKPLPEGISFEGEMYEIENVEFLYDLTYKREGKIVREQEIFDKVFKIIEDAEEFIVVDMFLFNGEYNKDEYEFPKLSAKLSNALINKKEENSDIKIYFITDKINTIYDSYVPDHIKNLKTKGIEVIMTDMNKLRDSNPLYSGGWRVLFSWIGQEGKGWLPNIFNPEGSKITLRSYLKLLNLKANHRKVLVTDKIAFITSANPHDPSAYHSNIAFSLQGPIIEDIIESEKAVARLSGATIDVEYNKKDNNKTFVLGKIVTEGKILSNMIEAISKTENNDEINMGMFYLSQRDIIKELIKASKRGVNIKIILDPNKDAFGLEKNGIPNTVVTHELIKKSNGKIKIRWYDTHGEQFHTKLLVVKSRDKNIIFGGSANLTRRNLEDYNLEANILLEAPANSKVVKDIDKYFHRIWNNIEGKYTVGVEKYYDDSLLKNLIYRIQELSGLSTF